MLARRMPCTTSCERYASAVSLGLPSVSLGLPSVSLGLPLSILVSPPSRSVSPPSLSVYTQSRSVSPEFTWRILTEWRVWVLARRMPCTTSCERYASASLGGSDLHAQSQQPPNVNTIPTSTLRQRQQLLREVRVCLARR